MVGMLNRTKITIIEVMKMKLDKRVREEDVIRWWAGGKEIGTV